MLESEKGKKGWIESQAPQLSGVSCYMIAAEISLLAGGLGRVMQYHGSAAFNLGADVIYMEPYYPRKRDKISKKVTDIDYAKLAVPVKDITKIEKDFSTIVGGKIIPFEAFTSVNDRGIRTYLIKDSGGYYVNLLYESETKESPATNYEFSEFFSKAALELFRYLEVKKKREQGEKYKGALVDINDGQALPMAVWRRIFYGDKQKILSEGADNQEINDTYEVMEKAIFCATTHTYLNRIILYDLSNGRDFLRRAGVPDEWLWLFLRKEITGRLLWDFTSAGLRAGDVAKAVSAVHGYEMNVRDPGVRLVGITNGDNLMYTSEFFPGYLIQAAALSY